MEMDELHYYAKSKKEKTKQLQQQQQQQQMIKLMQLQQKQEMRIRMLQQQEYQNLLKQQINQKLQENAILQQKLRKNSEPYINTHHNEREFNSPYLEVGYNTDIAENNPHRYDSISSTSTYNSMDSLTVPKSPRPRKGSFGNQGFTSPYQNLLSPIQNSPVINHEQLGVPITQDLKNIPINIRPKSNSLLEIPSPLSSSYDSMKDFKASNGFFIPTIYSGDITSAKSSPNSPYSRASMVIPNLGVSPNMPNIQSKSFSIDITRDTPIINGQQQKLYSRSPTTQCVDISTSEEAKKQRKSKKTSIFYIPPDNKSKPLSAVVSDVSDVSNSSNEFDSVTKNNTIINGNHNVHQEESLNINNYLYKNNNNSSADDLVLLKDRNDKIGPLRKSHSIGSSLNNYGMSNIRVLESKKNNFNYPEGETFVQRFLNDIHAGTGFENNILQQKRENDKIEMEIRRRTVNANNNFINSSNSININGSHGFYYHNQNNFSQHEGNYQYLLNPKTDGYQNINNISDK